ncbi:MAG: hypothetical protein LBG59_00860 [Candidatus Peribacteria bacterium]|jgi:hypothetical protein|nr:hypothetical protein [Candidatus Peribacteria bacterium]
MNVAITGCGTLNKGKLISETDFFSVYPELAAYYQQIELLGEAPSLHKERSSEIAQF